MIIDSPEKRKDYYVSRVSYKRNQPFTIKIGDARVGAIHEIENDGGYMVKLWIPQHPADVMKDVDKTVIDASKENNQEWFNNALPTDKIIEYFRPSINEQRTSTVLVSTTKIPRSIVWCGEDMDDFAGIANKSGRELRAMSCNCTLEIQGIYFYPKRFGVRWIVRNIEFFDPNTIDEDSDGCEVDREDIESFWDAELQEIKDIIDEDVRKLYAKVDKLNDFSRVLQDLLRIAKEQPDCNSIWERNLNALKEEIFHYKSGRL